MGLPFRMVALLVAGACFGQDLHFKTRTVTRSLQGPEDVAGHQIVQYDHPPGAAEIAALVREGMVVVGALPDNAVVVAAPEGVVRGADTAIWTGPIAAADKLSPLLAGTERDAVVSAVVEFHSDVTPALQEAALVRAGLAIQRLDSLRPDHAVAWGTGAALRRLTEADEVAYVFPADPELGGEGWLSCAGMLTTNGPLGQSAAIVHGWNLDRDGFAHLTYLFGSVTPKVPALLAQSEVVRALNEWAKVTNLTFQQGANPAGARNILIRFVSGAHGDAFPFDGPGNALAHTFYPVPVNPETVAGDMHLDADENWHAGGDPDIYSVALHEAGHAIGLGHSDKPGDVMYPYYRSRMSLSANDLRGAQALYGVPGGSRQGAVTQAVETVPPPGLRMTVDSAAASTRAESATLSGTLSGGKDPVAVQWQTAGGAAGRGTVTGSGVRAWNIAGIPLVTGENTISITAYDSASQSAAAAVTIQKTASAGASSLPLSIVVRTPAAGVSAVSAASLTISGVAGGAISRVTWQTSGGSAGVASGMANWVAAGVPLLRGTNTIVVRAWDDKGNSAWASLVVMRP